MRSIRRLDDHRATPLVLKSLHFSKDEDIDAYNFPPELDFTEDFSESEYGADSTISREWTLSPKSISEFEDDDIHINKHNDASEMGDDIGLEDEVVRCKPQQWTEYPKSEDFEVCTTPLQQSASDVDDEAFGPEPRPLYPLHQSHPESDDDLKDDEPLEANNPEPQPSSRVHQSHPESGDDLKDDEPLEANSSGQRPFSPVHQSHPESDDGQKDDEPLAVNSPAPRPLFPVNQSHPESDNDQVDDEPLEAEGPKPRQLLLAHQFYPEFNEYHRYQQNDEALEAESLEPPQLLPAHHFYPEYDDYHPSRQDDESLEADCRAYRFYPVFDDDDDCEQEDESLEANSPENSYEPAPAPQMEIFCPKPTRVHPTHKVILEPELFEDWFVDMSEPIFTDEDEAISPERFISETPSPKPQTLFPVRSDTPHPELGDDGSHKANSSEPRRFVPLYQFHPTRYDPPPVLELDHEGLESLEIWNFYH